MRTQHRIPVPQIAALAAVLALAPLAFALEPPPRPAKPAAQAVHHRKGKAKPAAAQSKAAPPPAVVEPPKPNWPVNDRPAPATVAWDNRSLRINASNSSLGQILSQISSATGAKIEGAGGDQRIFGVFGPGKVRDVLSQLLQGSGYNVVMIGDNGHGLPREVLLSQRGAAGSAPAAAHPPQQDDDYDDAPDNSQVDTQPQPPAQPEQPADNQPRTPQQMQEQQMMQQPGQPAPPQQPQ